MRKSFLLLVTFLSIPAFAANDQVPIDRTITRIQVYDNQVYIQFTPTFTFKQGCPNTSNKQVTIDTSLQRGKDMYSAALSAAIAKKDVGFGVDGCDASGREKIYRIDVDF